MAIKKEKFFEIIRNVSESKGLNKDNLLQKIKDELCKKDYAEYDKFKRNFSKEHQFSIKISDKIEDWTLLHLAVACDDLLTVTLLLEKKVSLKTRVKNGSSDGLTAFDIATVNGNQEIIQLLQKANPKLEKNKDKTPEGLVVNGNNAAAEPANVSPYLKQHNATRNDKQTSVTGESSDSTVDEQYPRVNVKSMIEKIESPEKPNATYSDKRTSTSLNESSSCNDSGICTESEDEEDIDAKNEELKKLEKELAESKSCIAEHETTLEALKKQNQKESESLKRKIQDLESKNTTLNSELEENENKHSKTKVLLERMQKELEESKSCIARHETKLINKENESLRQEIKSLENENTTLKGTTKTKTDEVSLEKVGKRQFSPKVAYASLAAMVAVGAALSIASGLSALLIVAASVVSALIAGGITYTISKPIAPDTELKEVDIQGSTQRCL